MSKQSNQRYRKELEKNRDTYSEHVSDASKDNCQNSSNTATGASSKTQTSNLVDRYQN